MNKLLSKIPGEYWAYAALGIWGVLSLLLLHRTPYGVDEGGAHALLLVWSVADDLVSPIVTLGLPDFRTLFFIPVGALWTGNVVAAKVTAIIVSGLLAWSLHTLRDRAAQGESALLATGLLLISPLLQDQIDTISVAPFLLFALILGVRADQAYREHPLPYGGMYFSQVFLSLVCTTLHPMGLAYPLALLWSWYKNPLDRKQRDAYFFGIGAAVLFALVLTMGWRYVPWFSNPVKSLAGIFLGSSGGSDWTVWLCGLALLSALLLILFKQARTLWSDMTGRVLLIALGIGALSGDASFALVALVLMLYWGLPLLMKSPVNQESGFLAQRGLVLGLVFLLSTAFMVLDRTKYDGMDLEQMSPRDTLIKALAEDGGYFLNEEAAPAQETQPEKKRIRVASQWPALTMLACRCDALPLPPHAKDSTALAAMLRGVDYLMFDPRDPANSALSYNLATMEPGRTETVALRAGGVIVQIKHDAAAPAPAN